MGCSKCKNKSKLTKENNSNSVSYTDNDIVKTILVLIVKFILFVITAFVLSIVVIPFSIYLLYKAMFLDGSVNVEQIMVRFKMINKNKTEITS